MADYAVNPRRASSLLIIAVFLLFNLCYHVTYFSTNGSKPVVKVPHHAATSLAKCRALHVKPGPPSDFYDRNVSDRFVFGSKPLLIRNATIWTGRVQGLEVIEGDVLLEGGLIKQVGDINEDILSAYSDLVSIDAHRYVSCLPHRLGAHPQVFTGRGSLQGMLRFVLRLPEIASIFSHSIIDVHSHLGVESSPGLQGAGDGNSLKGPILPWLRSLDGLNTHDEGQKSLYLTL